VNRHPVRVRADLTEPPGRWLTAEGLTLHADRWAVDRSGFGAVRITARGDGRYFLGIARQAAVDRWLAGTAHDRLVDRPGGADTRLIRSGGTPPPPPAGNPVRALVGSLPGALT
jgi:hypothetical protein